ncbi:MAG: helix-turn-helix domain-containing protein [Bradyrhizobium sp.]
MELNRFRALATTSYGHYLVDDWSSRLFSVCGHFHSDLCIGASTIAGVINPISAGGMDFVQVANDLQTIRRGHQDIRTDYGEHLFLLLQIDGECGIEQHGRQTTIASGDCALVDSSSPSTFYFGGQFSNHLSVHLPRQIFFSNKSTRVELARRVDADEPMSSVLRGLVAKLMKADLVNERTSELRQLLFNATRQAFSSNNNDLPIPSDCASHRIEIVQILIDRHLTEPGLTSRWLADRVGVSLRRLQEDFNALGTTVNSLIRTRRLYYARDQLSCVRRSSATTIAEIAYSAGFNDISYFNRCFKKMFDCSPKNIIRH